MASNKRLNATITIGGAVAGTLKSAFSTVKSQVGGVGDAIRNLEGRQRILAQSIKTFGASGKDVDGLRAKYAAVTVQVDKLRGAHERLNRIQKAQADNLAKRAEYRGQMLDAVAIGATAAAPIVMAAQFETAMLGVAKQVDGARDSSGRLTSTYHDMAKSIQAMSREIPMATNELADMVAAGARMGVAKEHLIEFTRTSAMMAEAFEMPAGELADSMGKIAGLYKIPIPAIGELADAINYLDDNAISKGGDIIEFLSRTGGVAGAVKITGKEMAALGSTMLTLGETTERAGTSVNAMFAKLASSEKGTKKYREAMDELGLSLSEVQNGMQTDALGTMLNVMETISKTDPDKHLGFLVDLFGQEHAPKLIKLVTASEELHKQLGLVNDEASKGSMQREFAARLETTSAQFQLMKNRATEVAVVIGSALLPAVNGTFKAIAPVVTAVANFARENPRLTQTVFGLGVALVTLKLSTLAAGYAFTFLRGGALRAAGILAGARGQMLLTSIAARTMGTTVAASGGGIIGMIGRVVPVFVGGIKAMSIALLTNPIGLVVAGIAVAGFMIYKHWDGVKAFMVGTFEGLWSGLQPVVQVFKDFWLALTPLHPAFEAVGGALKSAWEWFTSLLEPVKYSQDELTKAGAAGFSFGEALATGIGFVLLPLTTLIEGLTWVANNIGAIADKAVQFKNAVGDGIGGAWSGTKSFFGFGGDEAQPAAAGAGSPDLPVPAMATAAGGGVYSDQSQNTFQIVQQPGENNRDLARRIAEEQERARAVRERSAMTDGATAQ